MNASELAKKIVERVESRSETLDIDEDEYNDLLIEVEEMIKEAQQS